MKFQTIVKSLILEARELLDQYEVNGIDVDILYNTHSNIGVNNSALGRVPVDEVLDAMVEILEVIVEVSLNSLEKDSNHDKDKSILIVDNQVGGDYHIWVNRGRSGTLFLTINTSIYHPKHLPLQKNDGKIIITKIGDTIVKESVDNTFTSKVIGNIIVYYKNN